MNTSRELTQRQAEVFQQLCRLIRELGYPPSYRELCKACGLASTRSISDHLAALEELGYIRRQRDRSRAIEILKDPGSLNKAVSAPSLQGDPDFVVVPIVGDVAAGCPILAAENLDGQMQLDPSLVRDPNSYMLRVRGESMVDAHICDGDLVLIKPQQEAANGEIVVVMIGEDVTLKRFYRRDGYIELKPENEHMASIIVTPEMGDVRVLGKLDGVWRTF